LLDIIKTGDEDLQKRANYILIRLNKTFESRRKLSPSDIEIKHVEEMKPINIEMHFFSGAATSCQIESYTTIRELKTQVMSKLNLNVSRIPFYSIFEMCYKKDCIEERYIDEFAKVCDILSIFQKEIDDYKKQKIKRER
jgi:thiamine biosynthesis protein ThiC